jgi:hypothetical protein
MQHDIEHEKHPSEHTSIKKFLTNSIEDPSRKEEEERKKIRNQNAK